jgi:eukaryotic-like serine/threonine-protein kinase
VAIDTDYTVLLIDGKYLLEEKIGAGGMSVVYRGTNQKNEKPIAIKIMKRSLADDEEIIARFNREIRACLSLSHRNIVKVHAGGMLSTGELYLVMEFLYGKSLEEIMETQKVLPPARALNLVLQAAEGLAVAHKRGYVHRDVKPDNLMVVMGPLNQECVKVLDFGVAKLSDSMQKSERFATAPGDVLGTPLYMSPEQVLGNKIDGRADIYSLGCVLYECLSGKPAISGQGTFEVMKNQLEWLPPHINYYCPKKLPDELNTLVQKAIKKMPEERYNNMSEFADAIRAYSTPPLLSRLKALANKLIPAQAPSRSRKKQARGKSKK